MEDGPKPDTPTELDQVVNLLGVKVDPKTGLGSVVWSETYKTEDYQRERAFWDRWLANLRDT